MEENKQLIESEESSIGFGAIVWKHRNIYYKVLGIAFVVGCIFAFSLPRYYKCEVMLAPELSNSRSSSSLTSIARSFGIKLGSSALGNSSEALFPTLYPDLMNSVDFKTSLFPILVRQEDSLTTKTYYDYLLNDQKRPWWSAAIGGTIGAIASLFSSEDSTENQKTTVDPFRLTKKQTLIAKVIAKKVVCDVDQKTMVITIDVTDQDPLVCATVADSVKQRLQDFITKYRTNKARVDYEYNKKLYAESKVRYAKARQLYAEFADANQDMILQSARTKLIDLENEMQLQYNVYTSVAQQLTAAEARVQEETPAFTTLQSATVPLKPAGPGRKKILLVVLFLAFFGTTVWVLYKEKQLKPQLGLS